MRKHLNLYLLAFVCLFMAACGGVDQKDPRSVADEAIRCYAENASYKKVVYFQNEEAKKQMEEFDEWAEKMRAEHPEDSKEKESKSDYEFQGFTDEFGREATESSEFLNYKYRSEKRGRVVTVKLKKVDGKWYLDAFPQ